MSKIKHSKKKTVRRGRVISGHARAAEKEKLKKAKAKAKEMLEEAGTIVGTFELAGNYGFVVPDKGKFKSDIFVAIEDANGAVTGQKVIVEVLDPGTGLRGAKARGRITEVLGMATDLGMDIYSIARSLDLPMEFTEKCLTQANTVAKPVSEADMQGRLDLRDVVMVTIDGEDAKDLDDAVSLTRDGVNYRLGVHIADVTNYVQYRSALDKEAFKRGTSVYLADRVIPMLPTALSNGICSLNAGEDRLALSCIMLISPQGKVLEYEIAETVINVNERMSYTSVNKIIEDRDETECERYKALVPMFVEMNELAHILRARRRDRGGIDFDLPESKLELDENGHPTDIHPYPIGEANRMIEDFMLAANETVAKDACDRDMPFVYRIHERPDVDKIEKLVKFVQKFGYTLGKPGMQATEIKPMDIQKLITEIAGTDEETLIGKLSLRSMQQARYSPECVGHFGLADEFYCHFTSPIRRYPDLQIHRIIKDRLRGRMNEEKIAAYNQMLEAVTTRCSERERKAVEAERETVKLKKCQYMMDRIGEEYDGIISGVTSYGIYVELPNTVEGMVAMDNIKGDYYIFDEDNYQLIGQRTRRTFTLGQKVRVRCINADEIMRFIDFELV